MWCEKGDVIQSKLTGRFFLVLEESVDFKRGIIYTLKLQPLKPFRLSLNKSFDVRLTIDQIRAFNVGMNFSHEDACLRNKDIEPWEQTYPNGDSVTDFFYKGEISV